jgi:MFS family permease
MVRFPPATERTSVFQRTAPRPAIFALTAAALVAVFASSGSPIPLYNLYRTGDGLSNSALAVTTVTYLAVTALSLLVFGRLSDHVGRRPVAIGALLSSAAGCLLLTQVHSLPMLLAGRAFQGVACGIAASAIGSYVVDTAPRTPRWLAPLVTGSAPTFGIPLGALASGTLVQLAPWPRALGYTIVAGVLVVLAALMLLAPETSPRRAGALGSLKPAVSLPRGALLVVVVTVFLATWAYSGFYQAFASSLTADHLGTDSPVVIAVVFASVVVLSPVGGALSGRFRPAAAIRVGLLAFLVTVVAAVASLQAGSIWGFLGASLAAGLAFGAATTGTMRALLGGAPPAARAGLLSTVYLISYSAAAVPGLVAGAVASSVDLTVVAMGYAALVLVAVSVAVTAAGRLGRPAAVVAPVSEPVPEPVSVPEREPAHI